MRNKKEKLEVEIRTLAITKKLNFLIGSGASYPAISLMSEVKGEDNDERNKNLIIEVNKKSKILLKNSDDKDISKTLNSYVNFIKVVVDILEQSNSRQSTLNANIFTTNYDLFIEKAIDLQSFSSRFVFNDGSRGYFDRFLDSSNYNQVVSYRGLTDNYINQIPSISLIKPHGSVN
jgi:hypothetical protein